MFIEKMDDFRSACRDWGTSTIDDDWGVVVPQDDESVVDRAEERAGFRFPLELRNFYSQIKEGVWFGHAWADLAAFTPAGSYWTDNETTEANYESPIAESTPLLMLSGLAGFGLLCALQGPRSGELFVADPDRLTVRPYFASLASYFDFHIEMAAAGHLRYDDDGYIEIDRQSSAGQEWMKANGHPFAGDSYYY